GQPPARVGEVVWILTERNRCRICNRAELWAARGCSAVGLQPIDLRVSIRAEGLPSFERALFASDDESVVPYEVAVRIRHQEATIGCGVHEYAHRHTPAVGQRSRLFPILATHVRPSDVVAAGLVAICHRSRQPPTNLGIDAYRIFIGSRRAGFGINKEIVLGTHHRYERGITAGGSIECHGRDGGQSGMNLAALSGQYALVESSIACTQYRSVIPAQFRGDAQSWRD